MGRSISYSEAIDLVNELKRDFGSHLQAELMDWNFAAGYGDVMSAVHTLAFLNANRDRKTHPTPFKLPMPWADDTPTETVTAEERAEARAELLRRSAFAN